MVTETQASWEDDLLRNRAGKDRFFRDNPDSPLPDRVRGHFQGLRYFPPDPSFRITVKLEGVEDGETLTVAVSQGSPRKMKRFGHFDFQVSGQPVRLWAYVPADGHDHPSLFVPFRDLTSGKESYGAGRYLDLEDSPGGAHEIDFNLAYNPYCAYSENYSCPLPPQENWLRVAIRAGEMAFPHD